MTTFDRVFGRGGTPGHLAAVTFAIAFAACDGRSPSGPTPMPLPAPSVPTVTAVSPSTGSTARPTRITISGTGFLAGATVVVDVRAVSVSVINGTTITATIPAHSAGPADVVVINPGGLGGALNAAFTFPFEEPFTVTAGAESVDGGARLSVSWAAPSARPGDWLALFRVGRSYEDEWWGDTNGETSGTRTLTAPTQPGQYEFRYLSEGSFLELTRSNPVTVR